MVHVSLNEAHREAHQCADVGAGQTLSSSLAHRHRSSLYRTDQDAGEGTQGPVVDAPRGHSLSARRIFGKRPVLATILCGVEAFMTT